MKLLCVPLLPLVVAAAAVFSPGGSFAANDDIIDRLTRAPARPTTPYSTPYSYGPLPHYSQEPQYMLPNVYYGSSGSSPSSRGASQQGGPEGLSTGRGRRRGEEAAAAREAFKELAEREEETGDEEEPAAVGRGGGSVYVPPRADGVSYQPKTRGSYQQRKHRPHSGSGASGGASSRTRARRHRGGEEEAEDNFSQRIPDESLRRRGGGSGWSRGSSYKERPRGAGRRGASAASYGDVRPEELFDFPYKEQAAGGGALERYGPHQGRSAAVERRHMDAAVAKLAIDMDGKNGGEKWTPKGVKMLLTGGLMLALGHPLLAAGLSMMSMYRLVGSLEELQRREEQKAARLKKEELLRLQRELRNGKVKAAPGGGDKSARRRGRH